MRIRIQEPGNSPKFTKKPGLFFDPLGTYFKCIFDEKFNWSGSAWTRIDLATWILMRIRIEIKAGSGSALRIHSTDNDKIKIFLIKTVISVYQKHRFLVRHSFAMQISQWGLFCSHHSSVIFFSSYFFNFSWGQQSPSRGQESPGGKEGAGRIIYELNGLQLSIPLFAGELRIFLLFTFLKVNLRVHQS